MAGVTLQHFPFSGGRVVAAVTTRHGGVSTGPYASLNLGDHVGDDHDAVLENRRRVAAAVGVERLTFMDQQHGSVVVVVDAAQAGAGHAGASEAAAAFPATDALVTRAAGVALAVMVADCAPVVLVDTVGAVGVAHCGRGGTVRGLLPATVTAMREAFGTDPAQLRVGIGPCIAADSYEIGELEAAQVREALPDVDVLRPTTTGHFSFDITAALRHQLRGAGVPAANVAVMATDTRCSTEVYFSDRAARPCGRFAGVVALTG